ncbi:hypothetical protein [Rhizobium leguminosarum]|uniref:hypothetical protein n=1 Tax=Rhizobium leguminosarum TaxID=384 RepID=UPI001C958C29|nr:hypothetical protein [Rhizobium leguminosarum]MBY5462043.1 hypothetical protein [Rhizobium leguminosarum]
MRDTTVEATATKLFKAIGPSWHEDSYMGWSAVVSAWSVGATRQQHFDDRCALIRALQALDEAEMESRHTLEAEDDDDDALDEIELKDNRQQELF